MEADKICNLCFESVLSHYTFREKVFKNLNLSTEGSYSNPIQNEVKSYLSKLGEASSIVIHQDVLSIVPNSLRERFNSRMQLHEILCPSVILEVENMDELKEKLKDEVKSQQKEPVTEGIFGDDDFYVSNQIFNNSSIASSASLKRKSSTATSEIAKKVPRIDSKPTYYDETSQEVYNDEALDTSGESTSDCPTNIYVKPKPSSSKKSSRKTRMKSVVVSKRVMSINCNDFQVF